MYFVKVVIDDREAVKDLIPAHLAYLKAHNCAEEIIFYGATEDGGLMAVNAADEKALEALLKLDPLYGHPHADYRSEAFTFGSRPIVLGESA